MIFEAARKHAKEILGDQRNPDAEKAITTDFCCGAAFVLKIAEQEGELVSVADVDELEEGLGV